MRKYLVIYAPWNGGGCGAYSPEIDAVAFSMATPEAADEAMRVMIAMFI